MSFTATVKDELSRVAPTCSHCPKATLAALVRIEGKLKIESGRKSSLELSTENISTARLMVSLLHTCYKLKTETIVRRNVLHEAFNYLIVVPWQNNFLEALHDMGVLGSDGFTFGIDPELVKKNCCAGAYLRGAFLGGGFISEPRGDFHFEITVESEDLAQGLVSLMSIKDINARIMQRRSSYIVYLKSGESICEFLAFVGAHQSALSLEGERVRKSLRNDTNRRVNAELANSNKSASAAVDQIVAIRKLVTSGRMATLPASLQEIARLRLRYPASSMKDLGAMADPPLSKSAVTHRMRRIEEIARELS